MLDANSLNFSSILKPEFRSGKSKRLRCVLQRFSVHLVIRELGLQIALLLFSLPRPLLLVVIQDFALFSGLSCKMVQSQGTQVSKEDMDPADSAGLVWWGGVEATAASGA